MQRPRADHKAARLAALLPLYQKGLLDNINNREIGLLLNCHTSTAWRAMQELPEVARLTRYYAGQLGYKPKRRRRINRNF